MGQSKGKYVYFIFQQKKKVVTWVVYVSWASFCCLGESSCSRQDGFAALEIFVAFLSVVFIFGFVFSSPLDLVSSSICLLSAALCRLSQALSSGACVCCLLSLVCLISGSSLVCQSHQGYLRSAGQSGCIEGCAASNSGRSLIEEILCFVPKRK